MGKVGSSAYWHALQERYSRVYHTHSLDEVVVRTAGNFRDKGLVLPRHIKEALELRERVVEDRIEGRLRIISAVREPIARNVSAFFQRLKQNEYRGFLRDVEDLDVAHLKELFLESFPHEEPLQWFDRQVKEPLGFDVYARDFPKSEGWTIYTAGNLDLLVLKFERMRENGPRALGALLGESIASPVDKNTGEAKWYADLYRKFLCEVRFESAFLDQMYDNRYAQHFYSEDEIVAFRKRWGDEEHHRQSS